MSEENVHDGHRQRMRERVLANGADSLATHELLEMLLFYVFPRQNTNEIAHFLLNEFRDLPGVLDASVNALSEVKGMGKNSALFLSLFPAVISRYMEEKDNRQVQILDNTKKRGEYLIPKFLGKTEEYVYIICLDSVQQLLGCVEVGRGDLTSSHFSFRKIAQTAYNYNATGIVLAHNHPTGIAYPSKQDKAVTRMLQKFLLASEIELVDHIIVTDLDFTSMRDSGILGEPE